MKKFAAALLVWGLSLLLCACGTQTTQDISEVASTLAQEVPFIDTLTPLDAADTMDLYGLSATEVKDCVAYVSSGATAEEISVWEANSEADAAAIEEKIKSRMAAQKEGYADYNPTEVPKLENYVLKTDGVYTVLCVSDDNDAVKQSLQKLGF